MRRAEVSPVVVTDIDIPFRSLVWLVLKVWLATIMAGLFLTAFASLVVIILSIIGLSSWLF